MLFSSVMYNTIMWFTDRFFFFTVQQHSGCQLTSRQIFSCQTREIWPGNPPVAGSPLKPLGGLPQKEWFYWGSNPGPSACKADVITTTLWNHIDTSPQRSVSNHITHPLCFKAVRQLSICDMDFVDVWCDAGCWLGDVLFAGEILNKSKKVKQNKLRRGSSVNLIRAGWHVE